MSLPRTMTVVEAQARGGADQLHVVTRDVPTPGPGQLVVRVEAASLNFSDVKRRRGDVYPFPTTFPFVPGGEVAGTVAALGPGVEGPPVGTPVFALAGFDGSGGYAQYALALAPQVIPLPPGLDAARASTLVIAGGTAALILEHAARLQPGERILVPAARGGVGHYARQLARVMGAGQIIALAGPRGGQAIDDAAAVWIDYTRPGWVEQVRAATGGAGVDVALEASGGPTLAETLACLAPFGRAVVYGAASGEDAILDRPTLRRWLYDPGQNQSIAAFGVGGYFMARPTQAAAALGKLIGLVLSGQVQAPPVERVGLAELAEAHRRLESRRTVGKLVLDPWR